MTHVDMSENSAVPLKPWEVWFKAVAYPNEIVYRGIVNDPGASLGKAALWLAGASFISSLLGSLRPAGASYFSQFSGLSLPESGGFLGALGAAIASAAFSLVMAFVVVGLIHLFARAMGGTGSFTQLFYGTAAFTAPLSLLSAMMQLVPSVGNCLIVPLAVYGAVLLVVANRAAHGYDTAKAAIASLAPLMLVVVLFGCLLAFGAVIFGEVFNEFLGRFLQVP